MSKQDYVLAIDQGTTSTRSIVFDRNAQEISSARQEFAQHYPQAGWVEHCPEDIWNDAKPPQRPHWKKPVAPAGLPVLASRTSAKPLWSGTVRPVSLSTALLSGRIVVRLLSARNCGKKARKRLCGSVLASCLTRIFPQRSWPGCWIMLQMHGHGPKKVNSHSERSTPSCSGA